MSTRGRLLFMAALLFWLAAAGAATWRALGLVSPPDVVDEQLWGLQDFRDAVHQPARAFLDGVNPYDAPTYRAAYVAGQDYPLYSPGHLLLHTPFAVLALDSARWVWFSSQLVLLTLFAAFALRGAGMQLDGAAAMTVAALLLFSRPGHMNQLVGNLAVEMALATGCALHLARSHPRLAGLCLALTTGKPTFGAPLGLLMLCRGDKRAVVYGLLFTTLLWGAGCTWMAYHGDGWQALFDALREHHLSADSRVGVKPVTESWARLDASALWLYVTRAAPSFGMQVGLCAALLFAAGCIVYRVRRHPAGAAGPSASLIALTILLCIYHQAYDMVLLAPAGLGLLAGASAGWGSWSRALRWTLVVLIAVPFANYLATASFLGGRDDQGWLWRVCTALNGAALLAAWFLIAGGLLRRKLPGSPELIA